MKVRKDEGKKSMDPIFPRLHINDADKGGPRAPPRNKMALCEQYPLPSQCQRFVSGSMTIMPLPTSSNGGSSFVSKASSNVGNQKTLFPPFGSLPGSSHVMGRYTSYNTPGVNLNMASTPSDSSISVPTNYQNSSASGCNLSWPYGFPNNENSCKKKPGDETDVRVPSSAQSGIILDYGNLQPHLEKERLTAFTATSSAKLQTAILKLPKETGSADLKSTEEQKNQPEIDNKVPQSSKHHAEKPVKILSKGEKSLADAAPSSQIRENISEPGSRELASINLNRKISSADVVSRLYDLCAKRHQECKVVQEGNTTKDDITGMMEMTTRKRSASAIDDSTPSNRLLQENNKSLTNLESANNCSKNNDSRSPRAGNVDRTQDIYETSVTGHLPGLDLDPDDIVEAIGLELFWKARKTIMDHQRIFAMQLFELHRLIQVQRFIAGSPEVLYENISLGKVPIKFPAMNKLLPENVPEPPPTIAKPKAGPQKSNTSKNLGLEDGIGANKEHLAQKSTHKPSSTSASIAIDAKVAPWCFHSPSGNQWLVPVRSPIEGLIYKPYTGLCLPTVGFMAPIYGNCGPTSLNAVGGTAYGVPAPNQQGFGCFSSSTLGQNYFQPCGMPMITANGSDVEVDQMVPQFFGDQSAGADKQESAQDLNFSLQCQSSRNVSSQQSGVISDGGGNLHTSKESDLQGSTASSPEWLQGEGLSLFPTMPTLKVSNSQCNEQQRQVIKVVPHNPKSASESAARIFQSIQEERKKQR